MHREGWGTRALSESWRELSRLEEMVSHYLHFPCTWIRVRALSSSLADPPGPCTMLPAMLPETRSSRNRRPLPLETDPAGTAGWCCSHPLCCVRTQDSSAWRQCDSGESPTHRAAPPRESAELAGCCKAHAQSSHARTQLGQQRNRTLHIGTGHPCPHQERKNLTGKGKYVINTVNQSLKS